MGIFLNPGNSGFQSAVRSDIYIDKTKLIQFTNGVLDTEQRFLCVSRPRRFGKSVTAKMLAAYYSCGCNSQSLFEKMDIGNDPSYRQELNRNNVIYMDIQWFRSVARGKGQLKNVVGYMQEQVIEELKQRYPDVLSSDGISSSLPEVLLRIYNALGDRFIIIIDEWDCLFREEKEDSGLQEAYIDFLRGMFKGQPAEEFVRLAYMTGILPVKKYGTQSALNNFDEYTMINPLILAEYVGFTEGEVRQLCRKYRMDFQEAKKWYDGYTFKRVRSVYSPSSVTRAMRNREFGNYWTETETYESLKFYMDMDLDGLKSALFQMLGGARCRIDTGTFQNDMTSIKSRDDVLTLLIHLGYLAYDSEKKAVFIPNEEIRQEFVRAVKTGRRGELARLVTASDQLLKDTLDLKLHSCVIERYAREA
ncbi:MAG: AAA family ATPase [Hungatella sp.]|nr:AAA family ATPase [Hungatella sp.]